MVRWIINATEPIFTMLVFCR